MMRPYRIGPPQLGEPVSLASLSLNNYNANVSYSINGGPTNTVNGNNQMVVVNPGDKAIVTFSNKRKN